MSRIHIEGALIRDRRKPGIVTHTPGNPVKHNIRTGSLPPAESTGLDSGCDPDDPWGCDPCGPGDPGGEHTFGLHFVSSFGGPAGERLWRPAVPPKLRVSGIPVPR